jgi:glycosyltransferase involved in cell wall biosynthesis
LIEAAALLRDQVECSFLVVGSGPEQAKLMTFAERLGLDNVVFAGFLNQNEIARGFVVSDVFVLPSTKDETWGLVVNEAMNFGLPVVVSNQVGCATDLVHLGENGYIFRAGDAENLADYLAPLLTDASLRERFGLRSRELVGEWSYERAAHGVLEAVHAVVGDQAWRHAAPAHELISAQPLGGPAYDYVGDQQKGDQ